MCRAKASAALYVMKMNRKRGAETETELRVREAGPGKLHNCCELKTLLLLTRDADPVGSVFCVSLDTDAGTVNKTTSYHDLFFYYLLCTLHVYKKGTGSVMRMQIRIPEAQKKALSFLLLCTHSKYTFISEDFCS